MTVFMTAFFVLAADTYTCVGRAAEGAQFNAPQGQEVRPC